MPVETEEGEFVKRLSDDFIERRGCDATYSACRGLLASEIALKKLAKKYSGTGAIGNEGKKNIIRGSSYPEAKNPHGS